MREEPVRRRRLAVLVAAAATVTAAIAPLGGSASANEAPDLRAATVDRALVKQLAKNPTRGVKAIVTAWSREGLDDIQKLGVTGTKLKVLPMILTPALTKAQIDKLKASPAVRSVWANTKYDVLMEDTTWITRARYVWGSSTPAGSPQPPEALRPFGVTGEGVELAVIDTGFDGMHEDGDNLIEFCETLQAVTFSRDSVACTPWDPTFNPAPAGPCGALGAGLPDPFPDITDPDECPTGVHPARGDSRDEDVSHGTHVGGTVAGTGHASGGTAFTHSTIGMSPHAKLRVYSANVASSLAAHEILSSYDDMTYKKEQGYSNVVAVNNSWGGGGGSNYNPGDPQHIAIKRAWEAGILSVFSAGNSGPEHNTLGAQCVNPYVACVAANTKPDSVAAFSSKGRPSQVADTNRDGVAGGAGDVRPDNHDWRLGQALEIGRYRPTLTAPGVNINSMKALGLNIGAPDSATCREDPLITIDPKANCYVQANGTSMSAPHVTGAVGLIVQGFRQGHGGRTPTPNEIIDILERSSNRTKLPGWDAEEQGAGRLDAYEAVALARTYAAGPRPNLGWPTPPYQAGRYPGAPAITQTFKGCTAPASWTAREAPVNPNNPVDQPGQGTPFYGQHFIDVPDNVDRVRITIRWPRHTTANLYARLWRPGVNPDTPEATPDYPARTSAFHQNRVFPDQEALGLPVGLPPTYRLVEVRAPEESNPGAQPPSVPSGRWILRVYHRAGGAPQLCGTTQETPPQPIRTAYEYDVAVELPRVTHRPTVEIDSPSSGSDVDRRFVEISGRAGYPPPNAPSLGNVGHSWEGVTNWEVPNTAERAQEGGPATDYALETLYFHGNNHSSSAPGEMLCTGQGNADVEIPGCGPYLLPDEELAPLGPGARFGPATPVVNGTDRNSIDPNWVWCLAHDPIHCPPGLAPADLPGTVTVGGPMTVEWWASTIPAGQTPGLFTMGWTFRLWADGVLKYTSPRIEATPALPGVPSRLTATVTIPPITANQRLVLHVDTNELDIDQEATFVYYDSENPCIAPAPDNRPCDSLVRMPVSTGTGGVTEPTETPKNVRVTDLPVRSSGEYPTSSFTPALRVAWDAVAGASYEVYRSTDPTFTPSGTNRVYAGPGETCPQGESPNTPRDNHPPGEERSGRCFTDQGVSLLTTYYYRVRAVKDSRPSTSSGVAFGTPTRYDRQVKLRVDRLYGPQYWEYALLSPSPTPLETTNTGVRWSFLWDTLELRPGPHDVWARSFTQGIGSRKDKAVYDKEDGVDPPPPPPDGGCPDDDDGDGDDDDEDGDDDDNGDDDDDDCEDDDDDEEDEDD
jgi:serine protease AprX